MSSRRLAALLLTQVLWLAPLGARAAVLETSGTVEIEPSPHAAAADGVIYVFDEQQGVAFVSTQPLQSGSIAPGTLVSSHYVQFDPASPSGGLVGAGTITFDRPVLGVITSTGGLTADLSPDVSATSDEYFGLETTLGPYPAGADPGARGLGSPEDDLTVTLGSHVLVIGSLEIPALGGGNVDGFRVLTAAPAATPVPTHVAPWLLGALLLAAATAALRRS